MNNIVIKKINASAAMNAAEVPAVLDQQGIAFQPVDVVNWKEYPYQPKVEFRVAHVGEALLLNFRVTEASVRAVAAEDHGKVWEDACVEFFISPESNNFYYNFECNCIGKLLLHGGAPGDRIPAPAEVMATVKRWSSLGTEPFEEKVGECSWEVAEIIPAKALFRNEVTSFDGQTMKGNFYKCGDMLQTPHFLSWNPIDLPKPCFHCPEFFGELNFE